MAARRASPTPPPAPQLPNQFQPSGGLIEIAGRCTLEPYQQGALDGLCGLYGIINGMRLAMAAHAPLTKAQCRTLFAAGASFLHRKHGLEDALSYGMETRRRLALARRLAKTLSDAQLSVMIEQPDHKSWTSIDEAYAWIDDSLHAGKPVLVAVLGGLDHFTVIGGTTPLTLQLFDSYGLRFLRKSSCGLQRGHHIIPPQGLLRIAVQRSG